MNDQANRFAELFEHLLHADAPVVFHCTAGMDRTGFVAALLLPALGVHLPPRDHDRPERERLAEKYEAFKAAA